MVNVFTLSDIYAEGLISEHYSGKSHIEHTKIDLEETTLTDLLCEKKGKGKYNFLDSNKTTIKLWINMFDTFEEGTVPLYTSKPCWWCREQFTWHPIGCPLVFVPNTNTFIKEKFLSVMKSINIITEDTYHFETEGIFCSFSCTKSYIIDCFSKNSGERYKNSTTLLTLMKRKLTGDNEYIPVAGSWKVGTRWGGHLQPELFRAALGKLSYEDTGNVRRPIMFHSSSYIKEKRI